MATLLVTLDFSSDDGSAEEFVNLETPNPCIPEGVYDGTEGDPAGSVAFFCGNN